MADSRVEIEAVLDTSKAEKEASSFGNSLAKKIGGGAKTAVKGVAAIGTSMVAAGGMAVGALVKMSTATAETGDHIDKMSQKLGMSAEAYQKWDYIAKISGTSIDSLKMGFKTLTNTIDSANKGNKEAVEKFKQVGLSIDDLKNKSREDIFKDTIKGLQNVSDETERSALANKLLGRAGMELGPMLNSTNADLEKLMKTAEDYGMIMSDKAVKASAAFEDSLTTMRMTMQGLKNRMMSEFLPALTDVTDGLSLIFKGDTNEGIEKMDKGIEDFTNKLLDVLPKVLKIGGHILKSIGTSIIENIPLLLDTGISIMKGLIGAIVKAIPLVADQIPIILKKLSDQILTNLPILLDGIIDLIVQTADWLANNLDKIVIIGMELMNGIVTGLLEAIPKLIEAIPQILTSLVTAIFTNFDIILTGLLDLAVKIVESIPTILASIIEAIPKMIEMFFDNFSSEENFEKFIQRLIEFNKKVGDSLGRILKVIFIKIPWMLAQFVKNMILGIPAFIERLKGFVKEVVKNLPSIISGVKEWFKTLPDKIANWIDTLPERMYDTAKNATKNFINGLLWQFHQNMNIGDKIWTWLKNGGLLKLGAKMHDIGLQTMKGLIKGMMDIQSWAQDRLKGFMGNLVKTAKKAMGIESPSKVMADEVGYWMGEGIIQGFEKSNPMAQIQKDLNFGVGKLNSSIALSMNPTSIGNAVQTAVEGLSIKVDSREFGRVIRSY